jgi:hypothetical protein
MRSTHICKGVKLSIEGVTFKADLTLLPYDGLDVILGMDWLTKDKGVISCSSRCFRLFHPTNPQKSRV